jgi:S1-C subfamily serine protease
VTINFRETMNLTMGATMNFRLLAVGFGALAASALSLLPADSPAADMDDNPFRVTLRLPETAKVGASPEQILRAAVTFSRDDWKPKINDDKARGPAAAVYAKVAPAVVVVRTSRGSGTGIIVDPEGWIVTNHHVIAQADFDPEKGARRAMIYLGRMDKNGFMSLVEEALPALVYKSDEQKDLALLKLDRLPANVKALPAIELAKEMPRPGSDCVSIGHPTASLLWTVRSGQISAVGNWPKDCTDFIIDVLLEAPSKDKARLVADLANGPQRKIVVSTVGLNHGDSGGPLLDTEGKLIAVSYGGPRPEKRGTLASSYHVHLDEVRPFLADRDRPKAPSMVVPDPWPAGTLAALLDLDEDGIPDTVVFGMKSGQDLTGFLVDLKQSSDRRLTPADFADPARRKLWQFQFAYHLSPRRAFYATGNDGQIDLILTASKDDGPVDNVLRRQNGVWASEQPKDRKLIDPALFADKSMRDRFVKIISRMSGGR